MMSTEINICSKIITGDKTWAYGYDIETKVQSSQWKQPAEPRTKKYAKVGKMRRLSHFSLITIL